MKFTKYIAASGFVWLALSGDGLAADAGCGEFRADGNIGDYRDPRDASHLHIVERGHFDRDVESLIKGLSVVDPMGDIGYTLNRFPNHHRALNAMSRYYVQNEERWRRKGRKNPECYFQLALEWRQDDGMVWLLYGIHLHRTKNNDEAAEKYQVALKMMPDSAEAHYNLGLLLTDMDRDEEAHGHAIEAYQLGYPLPGLRDRLRRRGIWSDDDDQTVLGQAAPAAGAS